jgi:hypothetical protein
MNIKDAQQLHYGNVLYHVWAKYSDGRPLRGRVCSIRVWKRDPDRIRIGLRIGWKDHCYLQNNNLTEWVLSEEDLFHDRQRFEIRAGHLEIRPKFMFSQLKERKIDSKEQQLLYVYAVQLFVKVAGCNQEGLIQEDRVHVPASEFPSKHTFMGHVPTIRRAMTRMKRRAHKLFGRRIWVDFYDKSGCVGIRTI